MTTITDNDKQPLEVQGMARDPIGYAQAIDNLLAVLATSNYADREQPVGWLRPGDAWQHDGLYGDVWNALKRIAGPEFMEHLAETGEADMSLARRDSAAHGVPA